MQLTEFNHKIGKNIVLATFVGNIFKLKATKSFELSFERLGGCYLPEHSSNKGSVWSFPSFITAQVLQEVIRNTCFVCGGLMKDGVAYDNTWIGFDDFGGDAGQHGTTISKVGPPIIKKVRKCQSCGHSHT